MITKTLNLDDAYSKLFDEIREKSNGAIDINNVEGFFGNIIEITALDKKYLRLPLDEPMFEIDANSRKIAVPDEFKSNGLSVQGDHLAETVYFVIDRYFDYMDLSNTDVTINWKMGTESGKTDKFTMSASVIPGSIVFGWPVNNVVTQKSGVLTFAVEFCRKDNQGNILYDFNTLAASINIKDGLIVGDVEIVNLDNDIVAALANSQFGEGEAAVGDVSWLTGDGNGLVRNLASANDEFIAAPYQSEINLDTNVVAGVPSSVPVDLFAEGFVDAGSEVQYTSTAGENLTPVMLKVARDLVLADDRTADVKYFLEDGSTASAEDLEDDELDIYISAALPEGMKYFVVAGEENPPAYVLASDAQVAAWGTNSEVDLYVKLAKISANIAGIYAVKAQGQKFDNQGRKIGAGVTISSEAITVPSVKKPSAIDIQVSQLEEIEEGYSFDAEASANVVFLDEEDGGSLTASAIVDDFGALQFTWQKKLANDADFANISENEPDYKIENLDVLEVTEAGQYKVSVKNFKNGEYADPVVSDVMIASPLAGKITSAKAHYHLGSAAYQEVNGQIRYNSQGSMAQKTVTMAVRDVVIEGQTGELSYEWYKQDGIGEEMTLTLISSAEELLINSGDGLYVPVVKNNYNGSIYTYILDSISVDDIS